MRKIFGLILLLVAMTAARTDTLPGETLQINTQFRSVMGKPTWLLIIRDVNTGVVIPYIFDIRENSNFWVAFTYGHSYRITASTLKFGPFAIIHNFCLLENGILTGKSMVIRLSGRLTPYRGSSICHVTKYRS
jgi:hypothetical protein